MTIGRDEGEDGEAQPFPLRKGPGPPSWEEALEYGGPALEDPRVMLWPPDDTIQFEQRLELGWLRWVLKGAARSGRLSPDHLVVLVVGSGVVLALAALLILAADMLWAGPVALMVIIGWVSWLLAKRRP